MSNTKYNSITVKEQSAGTEFGGKCQKGKNMDGMTDKQFKAVMQMVIEIIKSSSSTEEAAKRVEEVMKKASIAE